MSKEKTNCSIGEEKKNKRERKRERNFRLDTMEVGQTSFRFLRLFGRVSEGEVREPGGAAY